MASYMYIFCPQLRKPTPGFSFFFNYPVSAILQGNEMVFCDVKEILFEKREEENGC